MHRSHLVEEEVVEEELQPPEERQLEVPHLLRKRNHRPKRRKRNLTRIWALVCSTKSVMYHREKYEHEP